MSSTKVVLLTKPNGVFEDIRRDEIVEQAGELGVGQPNAVEGLELLAEVGFKSSAIANVRPISVFEIAELSDEGVFDVLFLNNSGPGFGSCW